MFGSGSSGYQAIGTSASPIAAIAGASPTSASTASPRYRT